MSLGMRVSVGWGGVTAVFEGAGCVVPSTGQQPNRLVVQHVALWERRAIKMKLSIRNCI